MDRETEILNKYDDIFCNLPKKGSLKFGNSLVKVSSISSQYYCEKKLELQNEFPLPPTEQMQQGTEGHETAISLAEPVSKEEAVQEALKEKEKAEPIYEFGIAWIHRGVPIIGRVDEAWFRGGSVDLVVERKFSNSLTIYSPYHVQAQLYCLGLGEMGFDISTTKYRIIVFRPSCRECEMLIERVCPIFNLDKMDFDCDIGEAGAFMYPFKKEETIRDLDWAIEYWLGKREAVSTKNHSKCRVCEYKNMCGSSLVKLP